MSSHFFLCFLTNAPWFCHPYPYQALLQTRDLPLHPHLPRFSCQGIRVGTKSHSLGRRLWGEENDVGRTFITSPGPGRILIFLVCQESLGLTWDHASDEGRTGKKVLWGMTSRGSTEACKHLMIPCHGLHHWFISNRGKLWQGSQALTCWFCVCSKLWIGLRGHGAAREEAVRIFQSQPGSWKSHVCVWLHRKKKCDWKLTICFFGFCKL